jgi:hypothetical protein
MEPEEHSSLFTVAAAAPMPGSTFTRRVASFLETLPLGSVLAPVAAGRGPPGSCLILRGGGPDAAASASQHDGAGVAVLGEGSSLI